MASKGIVYVVGGGMGVPGLLTLRGAELLASADTIVFDRRDQARFIPVARNSVATRIHIGAAPGRPRFAAADVWQLLITLAREEQRVVYLLGEDPFSLGRVSELVEAMHDASVTFEVVPGVSSASVASSYSGVPLISPALATSTVFVNGTERTPTGETVDWDAVARSGGTVVVANAGSSLVQIVEAFASAGSPPEMPVAVISRAGLSSQKTHVTTLAGLLDEVPRVGMRRRVTLMIGWAVVMRDELGWFDRRALFGKRIVMARSHHAPTDLGDRFRELGAAVRDLPAAAVARLDLDPLRSLVEGIDAFDWIVFGGPDSVTIFWELLLATGRDSRSLGGRRIACVGAATAAALLDHGITVDVAQSRFAADTLIDTLGERSDIPGAELAYIGEDSTVESFAAELESAGASVTAFPAYRLIVPERRAEAFRRSLERHAPDAVVATSADGVDRWREVAGEEIASAIPLIARGASAVASARAAGIEPAFSVEQTDLDSFVNAVREWMNPGS